MDKKNMNQHKPIKISIKDFFLKGDFKGIEIGKNKKWILKHFDKPDVKYDAGNNLSIWSYGNIEFHFNKDELYLIFCDHLDMLKNTKTIKLRKWILKDVSKLTLSYVLTILNKKRVNYQIKFDEKLENAVLCIKKSKVELWFEDLADKAKTPNEYKMVAFGRSFFK